MQTETDIDQKKALRGCLTAYLESTGQLDDKMQGTKPATPRQTKLNSDAEPTTYDPSQAREKMETALETKDPRSPDFIRGRHLSLKRQALISYNMAAICRNELEATPKQHFQAKRAELQARFQRSVNWISVATVIAEVWTYEEFRDLIQLSTSKDSTAYALSWGHFYTLVNQSRGLARYEGTYWLKEMRWHRISANSIAVTDFLRSHKHQPKPEPRQAAQPEPQPEPRQAAQPEPQQEPRQVPSTSLPTSKSGPVVTKCIVTMFLNMLHDNKLIEDHQICSVFDHMESGQWDKVIEMLKHLSVYAKHVGERRQTLENAVI